MTGIKIPVEAQFSPGSSDEALKQFQQKFNVLGAQIAAANKVKFKPIDKATLDQLKQVHDGMASLVKISGDFRQRLKSTGQQGAGFLDVDWSKLYPDKHVQFRQMQKAMEYVSGGGVFQGGGGGGAPPGQNPARPRRQPRSQVARVARAGLASAGGLGQAANAGIEEGMMTGSVAAGLAGFAGGLAAFGIGKIISSVRDKVGQAQNELIGYDTLKRTLGDVNVGFRTLQVSLRDTARGLDMDFNESQALGSQFAKGSGIHGEEGARTLADEVRNAGGFARAFGLDPGQATGFFAQQRLMGGTKTTDDSRRLGLMIGEGIAKAGVFSKVDEVLEAIGAYTAQQTRLGMTPANTGGYMSFLTGMMGSGMAGTDPASSAALLARVNQSIQGGGSAGEAGQNFLYRALGSRLGLNPLQTNVLREQGAFGTGSKTFGAGSVYSEYSRLYGGGGVNAGAANSTQTNLSMIMEQFEKTFKDRPELMANAVSRLFGTSMSQAMALSVINKEHGGDTLGGMSTRLQRLGINLNDVNETGTLRMGQIEADKGMTEAQKDVEMRKAAAEGQVKTEGSETRATIKGVENAVQSAATLLIGPLNDIRSGIMYMAGSGKKSSREIMESMAEADSKDRRSTISADLDPKISGAFMEAERARLALAEAKRSGPMAQARTQEEREALELKIQKLTKEEADAKERLAKLTKDRAERMAAEDAKLQQEVGRIRDPGAAAGGGRGFVNPQMPAGGAAGGGGAPSDPGSDFWADAKAEGLTDQQAALAMSIYQQESSGGKNGATSNRGAVGGMQILPSTFASVADKGWDIANPSQNRRAGMRYIKKLLAKSGGNVRSAAGGYYGGEGVIDASTGGLRERRDPINPNNPSTLEYADQVVARMRTQQSEPLPDEAKRELAREMSRQQELKVAAQVGGTFHLVGANGQPAAAPVTVATAVDRPMPSGATGGW